MNNSDDSRGKLLEGQTASFEDGEKNQIQDMQLDIVSLKKF